MRLEVGVAERSLEGPWSGDKAVVLEGEELTLLAAIDGLGHGNAAAEAARVAAAELEKGREVPLPTLLDNCHRALERTRGVVMTVARIMAGGEVEWVGVGNVEARVLRATGGGPTEAPVLFGGVLGHSMRPVRTSMVTLTRGDLIVMATDGVRADFTADLTTTGPAQAIADGVMERHGKGNDDALVLVVRWLG